MIDAIAAHTSLNKVASAPENLEIRFVRAVTSYNLPGFFHRREQCESDFNFLCQRAERAAREGRFDPRLAAASLYYRAEFLREHGQNQQAIQCWKEAIRLAPQSRAAHDAASELNRLE